MKRTFAIIAAIFFCVCLAGCGSSSADNASSSESASSGNEVESTSASEAASTDSEADLSSASSTPEDASSDFEETSSVEDTSAAKEMDDSSFISEIESEAKWALGTRDKIEEVSLNDRHLYIRIMLERNNQTLDRFNSVTDRVLAIEDGYDLWDSMTVDFMSCGSVTKTKDDVVDEGGELHFTIDSSDIVK